MTRCIERVGPSTDRLSTGYVYKLESDGYIIDDNGRLMKPRSNNTRFWVNTDAPATPATPETETSNRELENTMLTVEPAILINGRNSNEFSVDQIIDLIMAEEAKIERLERVNVVSPAIDKLKTGHKNLITDLLAVLKDKG